MPWTAPADKQVVRYLERSLEQGRVSHAYLLSGPPGVGVMTLARQFAQALLCEGDDPPCGECRHCRRIDNETHADLVIVHPSANGSIGIDAVRDLQTTASLQPFEARGKVLIVDGAETMTREAVNAFLKLLEEPPPGVTLLLTTADEEAVIDTVRSRCQVLHLKPLPFQQVESVLRDGGMDATQATRLARVAGGRLEAALALGDDPSYLDAREEALDELTMIQNTGPSDRLRLAGKMAEGFPRDRQGLYTRLDTWASLWRDALLIAAGTPEGITDPETQTKLGTLGTSVSATAHALNEIQFTIDALRRNANPRLALESLLLNLPRRQ